MKYLCLVYVDESRLDEVPDAECVSYDEKIRASGHCVASDALELQSTARIVRVQNGRTMLTDGPFTEAKECIAGFYMVEARDMEEAVELAKGIPAARIGAIEVRPVRPIRETVAAERAALARAGSV